MGIQNLLQVLKNVTKDVPISVLKGKRVAVDGYYWLHRGAYACSRELCTGIPTDKHINFCVKMVGILQCYNITPVIVFDGSPLPSKQGEEEDREANRKKSLMQAREAQMAGKFLEANKFYAGAVDITPQMAFRFIEHLRHMGVEYIVAPFEADAQLAFLSREGIVDAVIAEDSDMIPYGVNCVINKLDKDSHEGKMILLEDVKNQSDFRGFTTDMIRQTCILSGCDYLKSASKFGLKKALNLMKQTKDAFNAIRVIRLEGKYVLPADYEKEFERAELTFKHQQVYDPRIRQVVPLTPLPDNLSWDDLEPFLGKRVPEDIGRSIAEGVIDPITMTPFVSSGKLSRIPSYQSPSSKIASPARTPRYNSISGTPLTHISMTSSASPLVATSPSLSTSNSSPFLNHLTFKRRNNARMTPIQSPTSSSSLSLSTPLPQFIPQKDICSFFKPVPKKALNFEEEEKAKKEEDENEGPASKPQYVVNTSSKVMRPFIPPSKKVQKLSISDSAAGQDSSNNVNRTKPIIIKSRFFGSIILYI